jgi:SAM-dependent methyltransferase
MQYYDWWVEAMFDLVPDSNEPVLELMCGEAELCRRLPPRFTRAAALDLNARMIESATRSFAEAGERRVTLVCGSATGLPFAPRTFSAVLVQGGFHHVRPIMHEVLGEIRRVLRPDGLLVASEPANDAWITRAIRHWQYEHSALQGNDEDEDGFTRGEVAERLAKAGLRLESYRQFGFIAYPLMANMDLLPLLIRSRSRSLGDSLMRLDDALSKVPFVRDLAWLNLFTARPA